MRHGRISELIRRSAGALLLLGSVGVSTDSLTFAQDANCATPQPGTAECSDDVYKKAGERLAQHLQRMGSCSAPCAPACAAPADCGNAPAGGDSTCQPGCLSDGCHKGSCLFGGLFSHDDGGQEEKKDPWTLMNLFDDECGKNCLKDKGILISGWLQMGYQNNPDGAFTGNGPFLSQHEHNKFNLNQLYLYSAKVADGTKGLDWGYRVDMMYGVDGNEAQSFGNINSGHWDYLNGWGGVPPAEPNTHGPYEWAMPQLYGEVAMGDLSVKLGHFYTPIGYEVVTSPDNFFLSRQITFYNSEPFTHTGALATYKVNDKLTVIGGWTLGWDTGYYQFNGGSNGIAGLTYTVSDKTTVVYATGFGDFGWRGDGVINSFILSHKFTDKLMWVSQFDVLQADVTDVYGVSGDFMTTGIAGDSTGYINYLFYEINEKWKAGARYEWYKADGVSYNTFTYGVNYKPTANLTIRPEMRHMWANDPVGAAAVPGIESIYGGADIFGIDAIFKF